ncbi:hypothetical protein [Nocardia flavorosea]|uniref:hypothetical protein n=1 Tax=Nocardia flavorosea TaxID=53429 RepID=UPI0024537F8C|nr:hypothetical protein [Nocardia flavorosea]
MLRYRIVVLPEPIGQQTVGRLMTTVSAGSSTDPEPGRAAWVWYPANSTETGQSTRRIRATRMA